MCMVTIEDLSEEDVRIKEKHTTLVGIAQELFGERNVAATPRLSTAFFCQDDKIMVYTVIKNEVIVRDEGHLQDAIKLAEAYEERTKEKWTVKRDYIE